MFKVFFEWCRQVGALSGIFGVIITIIFALTWGKSNNIKVYKEVPLSIHNQLVIEKNRYKDAVDNLLKKLERGEIPPKELILKLEEIAQQFLDLKKKLKQKGDADPQILKILAEITELKNRIKSANCERIVTEYEEVISEYKKNKDSQPVANMPRIDEEEKDINDEPPKPVKPSGKSSINSNRADFTSGPK